MSATDAKFTNQSPPLMDVPLHRVVSERSVLRVCNEISATDDRLGAFADYEGNKDGPTWHLWTCGKEKFANYCDRAIVLHEKSLKLWKRAKKLNEAR